MAFPFAKSSDFAFGKSGGEPCRNLLADHRCTIHDRLLPSGMAGCVRFDCFGAGQHVSQVLFGGRDWRTHPELREPMFATISIARWLHELLWYAADALGRVVSDDVRAELATTQQRIHRLLAGPVERVSVANPDEEWDLLRPLLARVSGDVRSDPKATSTPARQDLAGRDLRRHNFRRADLRGALLLGARLNGADLREADLLGTDLRNADISGADLSDALFITQAQINGAIGGPTTRLPATLRRPDHWALIRSVAGSTAAERRKG